MVRCWGIVVIGPSDLKKATQPLTNFTLMLQDVKPPVTPEIKPLNRPSFGPVEVSDGHVDPMLSNRVIEEPASRAFEQQKRPRFNADLDCLKGHQSYNYFAIDSDLRVKPKFNQPAADS